MKTKSKGGIVSTFREAWRQDFVWSTSQNDFVPSSARQVFGNFLCQNGKIETITYDDTKRRGPLKRTRKCLHTTVDIRNWLEHHKFYMSSNGLTLREVFVGTYYAPSNLTIPDLGSVHAEALQFFRSGCVEKHFDLAVDLLEWKQVTALLPSLRTSFKNLRKYAPEFSINTTLRGSTIKKTLKELSGLHLTYAFGIKPLVSDIVDLIKSVSELKEKVAWLRKNQGKPVKVRFSKDLSTVYKPSTSVDDDPIVPSKNAVVSYSCKYSAFALMTYNVEALSDLELQLRILTRNFGLDDPLSIVWERVPWSFVVDWVFKVGDLLESFLPKISLPYTFLDVGYSIKISESRDRTVFPTWPYKGDNSHTYGTMRRTLYFREPGLPTSLSPLATGDPGAKQLALALSLAIQKWK